MDLRDEYLTKLKREVDLIFRAPAPSRQQMVNAFFQFMTNQKVRQYDMDRIVSYFSGPGGPVSAKTEPSPLAMYQALNDDRKTQFHEYFNAEFQIATDNNPEQWHKYL
jgi:hypothetical protein